MKTKLGILLFWVSFSFQTAAQVTVDSLLIRLDSLVASLPADMIYIQTSKGIYETGEDLWFKAYVLDAQSFNLSHRNQTLFLQMYCETDGKNVWQEKYPIEDGIVAGHVYVPTDLAEGNYYLEAFTQHSFYADNYPISSVRKVRIVQKIDEGIESPVKDNDTIRLNVFPEGGYLVAGHTSRLAFKATNGHDYPVDVNGFLYEDEVPLLKFESTHAGMGSILFTPLANKTYRMQLYDGRSFPISDIHSHGITMQLAGYNTDSLEFSISKNDDLPAQLIYLVGQMRGVVCYVAQGRLRDHLTIKIPLSEFPVQGIVSLTLYDIYMRPVAERLVYMHPEKRLYITAELDKKSYKIREKATLKIKVTDYDGHPVSAHLGVGVFDQAYINQADPVSIMTHCHLTSQIRGIIYDPTYYFDDENVDRTDAIDLLMLTQGWRRYVWNAGNSYKSGREVLIDEITGIQTFKDKKFQNREQFIKIFGPDGNSGLISSDSAGHFKVDTDLMKRLRGGYVYLKPMMPDNGAKIEIYDQFSSINEYKRSPETFYPLFDLYSITSEKRLQSPFFGPNSMTMLKEVVVIGKAEKPLRDKVMGHLDSLMQINFGPWVCEHGPAQYLNDYLDGYTHHPHGFPYTGKKSVPRIGRTYRVVKYVEVSGKSIVADVFNLEYTGSIFTDEELLLRNNLWRTKGYYGYREFYQPDESEMLSSLPDMRNTLLWEPSIITDINGEATISFYCSDINTGFTTRIEGIGGEGLLGFAKFDFRVIGVSNN